MGPFTQRALSPCELSPSQPTSGADRKTHSAPLPQTPLQRDESAFALGCGHASLPLLGTLLPELVWPQETPVVAPRATGAVITTSMSASSIATQVCAVEPGARMLLPVSQLAFCAAADSTDRRTLHLQSVSRSKRASGGNEEGMRLIAAVPTALVSLCNALALSPRHRLFSLNWAPHRNKWYQYFDIVDCVTGYNST